MTNNLKCPFCGELLAGSIHSLYCVTKGCSEYGYPMSIKVWQALIDGKKAQDALKDIGKILLVDTNKPTVLTVKGKQEIRRKISSLTTQEIDK